MSYHWGNIKQKFPNVNNGKYFYADHNIAHEFKIVNNVSYNNWKISAICIYTSGRQFTMPDKIYYVNIQNYNNLYLVDPGDLNEDRLPLYKRIDIHISKLFKTSFLFNFEIGLSLLNIGDYQNIKHRFYSISYLQNLNFEEKTMLGFMPMVFISAKLN